MKSLKRMSSSLRITLQNCGFGDQISCSNMQQLWIQPGPQDGDPLYSNSGKAGKAEKLTVPRILLKLERCLNQVGSYPNPSTSRVLKLELELFFLHVGPLVTKNDSTSCSTHVHPHPAHLRVLPAQKNAPPASCRWRAAHGRRGPSPHRRARSCRGGGFQDRRNGGRCSRLGENKRKESEP